LKIIKGFQSAKAFLSRETPRTMTVADEREQSVREIINDVYKRGDKALFEYTLKFDKAHLTSLEVSQDEVKTAYRQADQKLVKSLELAAKRIEAFHTAQMDVIWGQAGEKAAGWRMRPLDRAGVYAPGGTASYPSTVMMTAIPARVAGVKEVILVTPPGENGSIPPVTLVAADIAGVDRIFAVGGAQALAALAFGTESIPKVDKICGPGNIYVFLAKKLLYGMVGIDGLQGPSEVIVIADKTADAEFCASEILAQAEHDTLSSAIFITDSEQLAEQVNLTIDTQLQEVNRRQIAAESLEKNGVIVIVENINEAVTLSNLYGPEHLCIIMDNAAQYAEKITNAGCVVAGKKATVVLGDYVEGPSHVLPTEGTARFTSPLNVNDFIKITNFVNITDSLLKEVGPAASTIARAEGLDAHARAVEKRLENVD